jgi:hypothetical protein
VNGDCVDGINSFICERCPGEVVHWYSVTSSL